MRDATNDLRDVIDTLHDIAQGNPPLTTTRDRITATRILLDRGFGKPPKRADTRLEPRAHQSPPARSTKDETLEEFAQTISDLSQIDSINLTEEQIYDLQDIPEPSDHRDHIESQLVADTRDYVLTVTNGGTTLVDVLTEIIYADHDDSAVRPWHRVSAARIILDRTLGADCNKHPEEEAEDEELAFQREMYESKRDLNALTLHAYKNPDPVIHAMTFEEREDRGAKAFRFLSSLSDSLSHRPP